MTSPAFVSYSRSDVETLERLRVHLKPLVREGLLQVLDDSAIQIGTDWHERIVRMLEDAKVAVLLVSADFLASEYIAKIELPRLLVEARGLDIIPVNVKPSVVERIPQLARLRFANPLTRPLLAMSEMEREATFVQIACAIMDSLMRPDTTVQRPCPGANGDAAAKAAEAAAILQQFPLSVWETQHLRKLARNEPFPYVSQRSFEAELVRLLRWGLIDRVDGKGIRTAMRDSQERNDLRNHLRITDEGLRYLIALEAQENTTALMPAAVPTREGSVSKETP